MAGVARTLRWWLLALLALSHAALGASDDSEDPIYCSATQNNEIFVRYKNPKKNGTSPVEIKMFYKNEDETDWRLGKTIDSQQLVEFRREIYISTYFTANLKPKSLYRVRVSPTWDKNNSSGGYSEECEFCSRIDILDPVRNVTKHSAGPNWFAVTWYTDPASCPKEMKYAIRYHDNRTGPTLIHFWDEVPGYPITLNTGKKYVMIMKGVHPNQTYFVMVTTKAEEGGRYKYGKESWGSVRTPLDDEPPVIKKPPEVYSITNTTVRVLLREDCTNCFAIWQYKEPEDSVWHTAGTQPVHLYMMITGLKPSTAYQVRAILQKDNECAPHESDRVPYVLMATLPIRDDIIPDRPPRVIKSSNTTVTVSTNSSGEYRGFIAHWQYKEHNRIFWQEASNQSSDLEMTIGGLRPSTNYDIRFSLEWPTRYRGNPGPSVNARTCPNYVPGPGFIWFQRREPEALGIKWSRMPEVCQRLYLIRWKQYDFEEDKGYPPHSYDENKCPYNATLLDNTMISCDFNTYCFIVRNNITAGRLYFFEVTAMDGEGRCSAPEWITMTSPYKFWGGISVGQWCLIIIGLILLFVSVPACIIVKKRLAAHLASGRSVTFSTESCKDTEDDHQDNINGSLVQEPTTQILERP